ncbi:hypothetical protein U1839_14155 [Sphingomonas sp. RT2P30]
MLAMAGMPNFECSVQGTALLAPPAAADDVCARIAARTERARARGGPVRIAITFTRAGVATARVTRTTGGGIEELPDISIATSDRAMSLHTVDMLADEIARALAPH